MSGTTSSIGLGSPHVRPNEPPRPGGTPGSANFGERLASWLSGVGEIAALQEREPADEVAQLIDAARELTARIRGLLSDRGIDTGGGLQLVLDGVERFRVASGHPQATDVEVVLASEPELGDELRALAERIAASGLGERAAELGLPTTAEVDGETFVRMNVPPLAEQIG